MTAARARPPRGPILWRDLWVDGEAFAYAPLVRGGAVVTVSSVIVGVDPADSTGVCVYDQAADRPVLLGMLPIGAWAGASGPEVVAQLARTFGWLGVARWGASIERPFDRRGGVESERFMLTAMRQLALGRANLSETGKLTQQRVDDGVRRFNPSTLRSMLGIRLAHDVKAAVMARLKMVHGLDVRGEHDLADAAVAAEYLARAARAGGHLRAARGKKPPRPFLWLP